MIEAVVFDMDGILFDTERMYCRLDCIVAAEFGYQMDEAFYHRLIGITDDAVRSIMAEEYGLDFPYDAFFSRTRQLADNEIAREGLPPKPHVHETLAALRQQGLAIGLASSTFIATVRQLLSRAGIIEYFDALIGGDMVPLSKPAPDIFLAACRGLGFSPQPCVAVEDSYSGIQSAHAAGCLPIMIPDMLPPTEETRSLCSATLSSLAELPPFISNYS